MYIVLVLVTGKHCLCDRKVHSIKPVELKQIRIKIRIAEKYCTWNV